MPYIIADHCANPDTAVDDIMRFAVFGPDPETGVNSCIDVLCFGATTDYSFFLLDLIAKHDATAVHIQAPDREPGDYFLSFENVDQTKHARKAILGAAFLAAHIAGIGENADGELTRRGEPGYISPLTAYNGDGDFAFYHRHLYD